MNELVQIDMNRWNYRLAIIIFAFLFPVSVFSQVELYTGIDTTRGFIGDVFELRVHVEHPSGSRIHYPDTMQTLGEFTVRDVDFRSRKTGSIITYSLATYDTGTYRIPSVPVQVKTPGVNGQQLSFQSKSIPISILSLVPPDASELKDLKPLFAVPAGFPWFLLLIGAGMLLAVFLFWRFTYRKKEEAPQLTPEQRREAAYEIAIRRLNQIKQQDYPGQGAFKSHFSEISETLREYIGNRYFLPALEMTTSEIMTRLSEYRLEDHLTGTIEEILRLSDLVKFAKYQPTGIEANQSLEQAFEIIEATKLASIERKNEASTVESEVMVKPM